MQRDQFTNTEIVIWFVLGCVLALAIYVVRVGLYDHDPALDNYQPPLGDHIIRIYEEDGNAN